MPNKALRMTWHSLACQPLGIRVGAVALGVLVDKTAFIVLAGGLTAVLDTDSTTFSTSALLVGTSCTTVGAYVAAHRANVAFFTHGLFVAGVGFVISFARFVAFTLSPPDDPGAIHPVWWELLGWVLLAVAGLSGGSIAQHRAVESDA